MRKLWMLIGIVLLAGGIAYWSARRNVTEAPVQDVTELIQATLPFAELTIPALRSRTYSSTLGELEVYAERPAYTAYLTDYRSDDLLIRGLLTIPKGEQPAAGWPAIIFVHGYIPPNSYRTTERYTDYVDYLAARGFVVFKIDLRGHGESEGEPGGAYFSADYVIDVLNARAALQQAAFVDNTAIGLWGHSMAGNVTWRAFVAAADIPALVVWGGAGYTYSDLLKYGINDASYRPASMTTERQRRRADLRAKYGDYTDTSPFWRQMNPVNYLDQVQGAVQLHHATDDAVVNVGYARDLMHALDETSLSHELFEYPTGGHNISGASFAQAMQRTVEFYREHLGE